jgi:hypothetical protein
MTCGPYDGLGSNERELATRLQSEPMLRRDLIANHPLQKEWPISVQTPATKLVALGIAVQEKAHYGQVKLSRGPSWKAFYQSEQGRNGAEFRTAVDLRTKLREAYDACMAKPKVLHWSQGGSRIRLVHSR